MKNFNVLIFILSLFSGLVAEELAPLPPIGISLTAPIQIDDDNKQEQQNVLKMTPNNVKRALISKRFPLEILGLFLFLMILKTLWNKREPSIPKIEIPEITAAQRLNEAQQILTQAGDTLSSEQSLALFRLLDPIATALPEPEKYLVIAERVKFAGHALKKSEFISLNKINLIQM